MWKKIRNHTPCKSYDPKLIKNLKIRVICTQGRKKNWYAERNITTSPCMHIYLNIRRRKKNRKCPEMFNIQINTGMLIHSIGYTYGTSCVQGSLREKKEVQSCCLTPSWCPNCMSHFSNIVMSSIVEWGQISLFKSILWKRMK